MPFWIDQNKAKLLARLMGSRIKDFSLSRHHNLGKGMAIFLLSGWLASRTEDTFEVRPSQKIKMGVLAMNYHHYRFAWLAIGLSLNAPWLQLLMEYGRRFANNKNMFTHLVSFFSFYFRFVFQKMILSVRRCHLDHGFFVHFAVSMTVDCGFVKVNAMPENRLFFNVSEK